MDVNRVSKTQDWKDACFLFSVGGKNSNIFSFAFHEKVLLLKYFV